MAKITIIDDEHGTTNLYTQALILSGFEVEHLDSVKKALIHIKLNAFSSDLYIIDLMMPPGDAIDLEHSGFGLRSGIEIYRRLRHKWQIVPVIILSSGINTSILEALPYGETVSVEEKIEVLPSDLVQKVKLRLGFITNNVSTTVPRSNNLHSDSKHRDNHAESHVRRAWREKIYGAKQEAVRKFLSEPEGLTSSEFLLLSDLSQTVIHSIVQDSSKNMLPDAPPAWKQGNQILIKQLMESPSSHARGKALEDLTVRLFNSVPGFRARGRLKTETEELDLFVLNDSTEAPWRDMGPAMIGECKKWSSKCGTEEYDHFESKVRNRSGQCKCGFFISWNGFTGPFAEQRLRASRENFLIVLIEGTHLMEAVEKSNFPEVLGALWEQAILS